MSRKRQEEANIDEGSEDQEGESQRVCLLCGEVPESIICLTCGHSIDIPCATRVILEVSQGAEPDISKLDCLLCGQTTELSAEVQAAIIAYGEGEQEDGQEEGYEEIDEGEEEMMGLEEQENKEKSGEPSFNRKDEDSHRKSGASRNQDQFGAPASKKQSVK